MLKLAAITLACVGVSCGAASAQEIQWGLMGTDPLVVAPVFPQPADQDYFRSARYARSSFLHPAVAASFATLRANAAAHSWR